MRRAIFLYLFCFGFVWSVAVARNLATNGGSGGLAGFPAITGASFGTVFKYNMFYPPQTVNGDGWNTTWDDTGRILTIQNDGSSWNSTGSGINVKLNLLTNTNADVTTIGSDLNTMSGWNGTPPPDGTWKWNGIISATISGTHSLFAVLTNLNSATTADNFAQLIKSTDHGVTFAPAPPYGSPMWPTGAGPYSFIQYGQDYTGCGPDNSCTYIYATAFLPAPTGGVGMSRVLVSAISAMSASDWQYWTGGDGSNPANWSSSLSAGVDVPFTTTTSSNLRNMQYLPRYGKYLALTFDNIPSTVWYVLVCDHPWGPCNQLGSGFSTGSDGWYLQSVAPNSLVNGGQQMMTTTAGNFSDAGNPTGRYTLTMIPLTLTP